jgi:hypothetical protein
MAYHLRAQPRWYGGSLQEAVEGYWRALQLNPSDMSVLLARGQVFVECDEFNWAVKDLALALDSIGEVPAQIESERTNLRRTRETDSPLFTQGLVSSFALQRNLISPSLFAPRMRGPITIELKLFARMASKAVLLRTTNLP